ncbi:MAG: hypothetical protein ACYDBB_19380 [Armatimonadota bacterium]
MAVTTTRIERVLVGGSFPRFTGEDPATYWDKVERHAEKLHRCGATHVMINEAIVSIPWVMDPENSYLRFSTYGHTPDKFVTSTYNEGLFHDSILEENRKLLLWNAKLAKQYGFRCWVRCVEMTFMPESFFRRYPDLRGPRVDNPACSTTPLFALCPEVPEVQDHYRQLTVNLLKLVPEIDEMHIFTCDSGGGFCYSKHLYSGSNGPVHCQHIPTGKQAQTYCRTLINAGREVNPDFRVVMTSGLLPDERKDLLDGAPEGLAVSVFGAFAWGGGMEDRWANMAVGPEIHQPEVRAAARAWQDADMKTRIDDVLAAGNGSVYISYNPDYYGGPSDAPCPYQTHEVMMKYLQWGARSVIGGASGNGKYSANSGIFVQATRDGVMDTDAAVRKLAATWVGDARADKLCEAWRLSELADREWPMPAAGGHSFYCQPLTMAGPIIPNADLLGEHDLDYYLTPVVRDQQKMKSHQGGVWRILHYRDEIKRYVIRQLEEVTLPTDDKALAIIEEMLADSTLTAEQRECLLTQRSEIGIHRCFMACVRNWFQASYHVCAGSAPYAGLPSLPEIIQQEIDTQQRWYEYGGGAGQLASPRQRLMIAHKDDPVKQVDLREFPYHEYLGLNHWPGAHLEK